VLQTVADNPASLGRAIDAALSGNDVLLLTGGVSVGDFDYVPRCLEETGAEILFHGVAVKPGKPTLLARRGSSHIFGLPGNPVSTFVVFEVFVKPFVFGLMGVDWQPPIFRGVLAAPLRRRSTDRTEYLPVRVERGSIRPLPFHGSSHLNALGEANALATMAKGVAEIPAGETIDVRPI
jgi:molybdopterin molybdotransferase